MLDQSQPFVLFRDDVAGETLLFEQPSKIIAPTEPADFFAALGALERAKADGKWLAGYFSYEAGYLFEPKLAPLMPKERRVPLMVFGIFDGPSERRVELDAARPTNGPIFDARATWTIDDYRKHFDPVHEHLRRGDNYQTNLTFPIHAQWTGDPLSAFAALIGRQPVKYGALVSLEGPKILSRSPELFFDLGDDGWIETRPMKGTVRRGATKTEDEKKKRFLRNDPKNQAENRMIVDLLRNDISRISEVGTLHVPELFKVETYPTLHTMVSTIRAKALPGLSIADIFAALFPCGSITGAPKIRSMEIIHAQEETARGAYCGAIGWAAPGGRMRFNVAIRTITLFPEGEAVYNVGGGVVFDSDAESEYQECLLKARFATGTVPSTN
ncbi:MAG TPA: aminodeoxychorismate synthase component I [Rhizobiaceae bacterium]|nr:aminodeoxychorismate synthase component I [Rhizobiaceae bacterium]